MDIFIEILHKELEPILWNHYLLFQEVEVIDFVPFDNDFVGAYLKILNNNGKLNN